MAEYNPDGKGPQVNLSSPSETIPHEADAVWGPGFWKRFPVRAFSAMVVATIMAACMSIVLGLADGRPAPWKASPTVLIAAATAVANALGRYALSEGVAVACKSTKLYHKRAIDVVTGWKKACSPGIKLEDLHHIYCFGNDVSSVVRYFYAFNFVALASLAVSFLPINGILLQRAITMSSIEVTSGMNMSLNLARQFPEGYTGIITNRGSQADILTTDFSRIVQDFASGTPQNLSTNACRGRCSGVIEAPGYTIQCREDKTSVNLSAPVQDSDGNFVFVSQNETYQPCSGPTTSATGVGHDILLELRLHDRG